MFSKHVIYSTVTASTSTSIAMA